MSKWVIEVCAAVFVIDTVATWYLRYRNGRRDKLNEMLIKRIADLDTLVVTQNSVHERLYKENCQMAEEMWRLKKQSAEPKIKPAHE